MGVLCEEINADSRQAAAGGESMQEKPADWWLFLVISIWVRGRGQKWTFTWAWAISAYTGSCSVCVLG